jgi:hypothetical protein
MRHSLLKLAARTKNLAYLKIFSSSSISRKLNEKPLFKELLKSSEDLQAKVRLDVYHYTNIEKGA